MEHFITNWWLHSSGIFFYFPMFTYKLSHCLLLYLTIKTHIQFFFSIGILQDTSQGLLQLEVTAI